MSDAPDPADRVSPRTVAADRRPHRHRQDLPGIRRRPCPPLARGTPALGSHHQRRPARAAPPRAGHDGERELQTLARCPLLLLDDLGAAKTSEWTEELTYRLINHRYEHMLPTLITTNLPIPELRSALGDRVASRLAEMTERVILTGPDRRRTTPAA